MAYIDSNIPKSIFHSPLVGEFLRIAHSFLPCKDVNRMKAHGAQSLTCRKALFKMIRRNEKAFANFGKNCEEILSELHT